MDLFPYVSSSEDSEGRELVRRRGNGEFVTVPVVPLPLFKNSPAGCAPFFVETFEDWIGIYDLDPASRLCHFEASVKETIAEPWLRVYLHVHGRKANWDELICRFLEMFNSELDQDEAERNMVARILHPNESARTYVMDKLCLIVQYDSEMKKWDQINHIRSGLPRNYQEILIGCSIDNVDDFVDKVVHIERDLKIMNGELGKRFCILENQERIKQLTEIDSNETEEMEPTPSLTEIIQTIQQSVEQKISESLSQSQGRSRDRDIATDSHRDRWERSRDKRRLSERRQRHVRRPSQRRQRHVREWSESDYSPTDSRTSEGSWSDSYSSDSGSSESSSVRSTVDSSRSRIPHNRESVAGNGEPPSQLYNFTTIEMVHDGNCAFRAISYGLTGRQGSYLEVKHDINSFIFKNW